MIEASSVGGFDRRGVGEFAGCCERKKPGSSPGFFLYGDHPRILIMPLTPPIIVAQNAVESAIEFTVLSAYYPAAVALFFVVSHRPKHRTTIRRSSRSLA
jgi:hypothetical protein